MTTDHECSSCSTGCTSRRHEEGTREEVSAAPYLLFAGIIILVASVVYRWLTVSL
jgi:hypothetical protein